MSCCSIVDQPCERCRAEHRREAWLDLLIPLVVLVLVLAGGLVVEVWRRG